MAAIDRNILRLGAYELLYCAGRSRPRSPSTRRWSWPSGTARRSRAGSSTGSSTGSRPPGPRSRPPTRPRPSPNSPIRKSRRSRRGRASGGRGAPASADRGSLIAWSDPDGIPGPRGRPDEPSADLHVHTTHSDGSCSPGEVIRAVNRIEQRIAEAQKLGFEKIIVSKYNLSYRMKDGKDLDKNKLHRQGIEVVPLGKVEELYQYLF